MIQQTNKLPGNPTWQKGVSGNSKGRPLGARQRIAEKMLADLADVWERRGAEVLERLADDEPSKLAALGFGLLPKDIFVQITQKRPGNLSAEEYETLRGVLDAIEAAKLGDVPPAQLFSGIESYLRGEFAKTIEHAPATSASPARPIQIDIEPALAIALPAPPY